MIEAPTLNGSGRVINGALGDARGATIMTPENIATLLANDHKVKVAGLDSDGVLRGKVMSKEKFLVSIASGFAMSSAVFGWDMHDELYSSDTCITSAQEGYCDFMAVPDLKSFRRLPFEDNIPFFLIRFLSNGKPVSACGRSMMRSLCTSLAEEGYKAMAGGNPPSLGPKAQVAQISA